MCEFLRGAEQLVELNASLHRLIEIDLQFDQAIGIVEISVQMEELRRLVLLDIQERKSNASGRGIFGRRRFCGEVRRRFYMRFPD
ncbi:hypothetical protein PanWU01x14_343240 [Parasponia andersonii]|uniref:Uncharacterized protein n=1 Tax=Parasponia andersonii TaxID=3476 RepID=A0A2P5ADI7_PARAD|nr:hypothetical protein PanWU01x14_343240 [Parasponia andersonii]